MLVVLLIPALQGIFDLTVMTGTQWGIVAGLSLVPLAVMEIAKGIGALLRHIRKEQ